MLPSLVFPMACIVARILLAVLALRILYRCARMKGHDIAQVSTGNPQGQTAACVSVKVL